MTEDRSASDARVFDRTSDQLARLREIMQRLRAPDGCPWDAEQTWESIAPYTIEEACEVADAIERNAPADIADELGDLLLQVIYHSEIAAEGGHFTLDDVMRGISDKMVRRHPHVFGETPGGPKLDPAKFDWEALKAAERAEKGDVRESVLDGVPPALSGLTRALKLTRRAASVGFDWTDPRDVLAKLAEETGELLDEIDRADQAKIAEEYGDLLFVMTNLARHLKVDPEAALRGANAKFERRFRHVETRLAETGRPAGEATLPEMDALWDEAKARGL